MGIRMQGLDFVEIMAVVEVGEGSNPENQFSTQNLMLSCEAYYPAGYTSNEIPALHSLSIPMDLYNYSGHFSDGYFTRQSLNPSGLEMDQILRIVINPTLATRENRGTPPSFPVHARVSPVRRNDGGASSSQPLVDIPHINHDDPFPEDKFDEASIESDSVDDEANLESFIVAEDELSVDEEARSGDNEFAVENTVIEYCHPFHPPPISFMDIGDDANEGDELLDLNFSLVPNGSEPAVGMEWRHKKNAVAWVKEWLIRYKVECKVHESHLSKWIGRCVYYGEDCSWEICLVKPTGTGLWRVKEVSPGHTCRRPRMS